MVSHYSMQVPDLWRVHCTISAGNQEAQLIIKPLPKHLQLTPLQPAAKVGAFCLPACSGSTAKLSRP